MAEPTASEQYLLELVNRARANPNAEANRYNINLNDGLPSGTISSAAKQPLAFNLEIIDAARSHSQWMLEEDIFDHTGEDDSNAGERMEDAGFNFTGNWEWGENLVWRVANNPNNLTQTINLEHQGLFESEEHRENLLNPDFREIGIGALVGEFEGWNVLMTTENFARSGSDIFLTGVAFDDSVRDNDFYTIGEGLGGLTVTAVRLANNRTFSTTTMDAGGYQLALRPGTYEVTFSGNPLTESITQTIVIGSQNVKLDLDLNNVNPSEPQPDSFNDLDENDNSQINGTSDDDKLVGGSTNQTIKGRRGDDYINGRAGNDILRGASGNDILIGGKDNDQLIGGSGDDILIGVDPDGANPGEEEFDFLWGGTGNNIFVLGDANNAFYLGQGTSDRAEIGDFDLGQDTIMLHGSMDDYQLKELDADIQILYTANGSSEVIGVIQDVDLVDLYFDSEAFDFV